MPDAAWQDAILDEFAPGVSPLTVVADPDGLLEHERIHASLRERGFWVLRFEDPVAFRYAYESRFRGHAAQGGAEGLIVHVPGLPAAVEKLPYDILARSRRLAFSLGELFPSLHQAVVAALEPADRDALHEALGRTPTPTLGVNASKDFVLRHVFGIVPELVRTPAALLAVLLRRHYAGRRVPAMLDARFIEAVKGRFRDWPLAGIVPDREAFFGFLQAGWRVFLDSAVHGAGSVREGINATPLLPFDHEDIRVYVDNLFAERLLQPIRHGHASTLSKTWRRVGVRWDERQEAAAQLDRLLAIAAEALPAENARHEDWFRFALVWAKVTALIHDPRGKPSDRRQQAVAELRTRLDAAFARWVETRYAGLANLPPNPPVMLHHVPRFLAQQIDAEAGAKVALVVVDGLALDQWVVVRQELARQRPGWRIREGAAFAWVPTVTSTSRQAVFAGAPPFYFPDSIHGTHKEPALWRRFWADQGLPGAVYAKSLGGGPFENVATLLQQPGVRVAGLVVDKVDRIMHGITLGTAGMHNQVRQWMAQGHFAALLSLLFQHGFHVYLTSDHGNIEAEGCGRPDERSVADLRGERVRVYPDDGLRRRVAERFPDAWQWPADGLPENYLPLLAPARKAFVREGERVVAHGGVCLEELIVPFARVEPPE